MVKYRNVARDINCSIKQYRCWLSDGYLGTDGYGFYGPKSGINNLIDFTYYSIPDGYVGDFLFPLAEKINNTKNILPLTCDGASSAVVDGYIYIFGGKNSDKILKAHINDPNKWTVTDSVLPTKLHGSSLIESNNVLYLLGGNVGNDDGYVSNVIYYAFKADPLSWYVLPYTLAEPLSYSTVIFVNQRFYLVGGITTTGTTSKIYKSNILNPFVWTVDTIKLPHQIHSSTYLISNNTIYLFGGVGIVDGWNNKIYSTSINLTTDFSISGTFPAKIARAHSFIIGNIAYIYSHVDIKNNLNQNCKIFKCNKFNLINGWVESNEIIKNKSYNGVFLILNDRIYLFGGSGSTNIQVSDQLIDIKFNNSDIYSFDKITRIDAINPSNFNNINSILGFDYLKTNYLD